MTTLAFDVYGTLIDTNGVVILLQNLIGEKAKPFAQTWREKQLEYSFRRGLMKNYESFEVCTSHALDYTCLYYDLQLTKKQKYSLLESYKTLPVFSDVKDSLVQLKIKNFHLYALSNGSEATIERLLLVAGIRDLFLGVVSVDDLKTFKPNPSVYNHFLDKASSLAKNTWLISSNPFDVIGARAFGMQAAWVKRSDVAIFDPWDIEPTITISNLSMLSQQIVNWNKTNG